MTDKEKIKQEIEKRLSSLWDLIPEGENVLKDDFTKEDANNLGKYTELESLLNFIDSLPEEPVSENLEEEILNKWEDDPHTLWTKRPYNDFKNIARHFAEWQKHQDEKLFGNDSWSYIGEHYPDISQEEKLRLYDIAIKSRLAGANAIKQKMMKDAVLETKVMMDCDGDGIETPYEEWLTLEDTEIPYIPNNLGLKEGDKVKIIIVN